MSADVIVNYFFRAGSSYRNNNIWVENFTVDGVSQIARSGRFGVGVLASFLLGSQIEVGTKKIDSEKGYTFTASIDDVQIEVNNTSEFVTGTNIKIKLNEKTLYELKKQVERDYHFNEPEWYAWYLLKEPNIIYQFPEEWEKDGFNKCYTTYDISVKNGWRQINVSGYYSVYWKFNGIPYSQRGNSGLLCNGIVIPDGYRWSEYYESFPSMAYCPSVVVFDNEGLMPLSLTRKNLENNRLPFELELSQSLDLYSRQNSINASHIKIREIC
jgi:molecular chaperone HtpG